MMPNVEHSLKVLILILLLLLLIIIIIEKYLTKNFWFITYSARWIRRQTLENTFQK
jgi:uncharacterized protein HemY